MTRLLSTLQLDMRVQFRHGFYFVSGFIIVLFVALLRQLPGEQLNVALLVPPLVVFNGIVTTFFFVGALVLLEKGEGVLAGLVVTPLRRTEYLLSKVGSLTLLAMGEIGLLLLLGLGPRFRVLPLLAGMALLFAFYTLAGFVTIVRYDSINEYLLPAVLVTIFLFLPLVDYLGLWESWLFYLHPVQPALLLLRAAFEPLSVAAALYAVGGALFWLGLSFVWARRVFHGFVVRAAG